MNARPIVFASPAGPCFGWFHPAAAPPRRTAVVMCSPLGYEALCAYRAYTQLAGALALAGFDVLRFDYHGTGDSPGGDADPQRVHAWLASTRAAMDEAQRLSGAPSLALFGLRFGATLALHAAAARGGVDSLVLWAPCASSRAFIREMRAAEMSRAIASSADGLEALGMLFTQPALDEMLALDARAPAAAPARDVLVIGRDDLPGEGPVPARLRALGSAVAFTTWPGYTAMMAEPHEAVLDAGTLASITAWFAGHHPACETPAHPAPVRDEAAADRLVCGPVVEMPVRFGPGQSLFGMLSEPAAGAAAATRTAVLLLNVGGNYRIGPNRNYVKAARELAAAGHTVLRFDVAGVGDSGDPSGRASDSMYRDWATADVSAAIDLLLARGCERVYAGGICSGSYLAFETALKDTRVTGIVLANSRLLEWDHGRSGPWQSSMQRYYKSTRYYRRALLRPEVYVRLLRGDVDVRGIARRFGELVAARAGRAWSRWVLRRPPAEGVLAKFRHLARRGVRTLVIMSEQDDGLDYVQFHLGTEGSRMRGQPGFRMVLIPDADHTFSTVGGQRAFIAQLRAFLDGGPATAPQPGHATVKAGGCVATSG